MNKTFLICPIRGVGQSDNMVFVAQLEAYGYEVYYPARDTDQEDETGIHICFDNESAIRQADYVHFVWDGKSQGCLFDLGMAFAMRKKIIVLHTPPPSEGKSFQNMVREYENRYI